jgi:hypothetical protein
LLCVTSKIIAWPFDCLILAKCVRYTFFNAIIKLRLGHNWIRVISTSR